MTETKPATKAEIGEAVARRAGYRPHDPKRPEPTREQLNRTILRGLGIKVPEPKQEDKPTDEDEQKSYRAMLEHSIKVAESRYSGDGTLSEKERGRLRAMIHESQKELGVELTTVEQFAELEQASLRKLGASLEAQSKADLERVQKSLADVDARRKQLDEVYRRQGVDGTDEK